MASFGIAFRTQASLLVEGEPSDFITQYDGLIVCTDDEPGKVNKVGRFHAMRIHAGLAVDAGKSLFEVCDAHSHELHHLHSLLYDDEDGLKGELVDRFDAAESDVLVLDYIILNPKWRRLKLGLLAVRRIVDLLGGGCGLAVSLIAPLLPTARSLLRVPVKWFPHHRTKEQMQSARIKLRRYFRRLGFRRLGRSPYYALSLHQIMPNSQELLGRGPG
jgi:hypothetical protein